MAYRTAHQEDYGDRGVLCSELFYGCSTQRFAVGARALLAVCTVGISELLRGKDGWCAPFFEHPNTPQNHHTTPSTQGPEQKVWTQAPAPQPTMEQQAFNGGKQNATMTAASDPTSTQQSSHFPPHGYISPLEIQLGYNPPQQHVPAPSQQRTNNQYPQQEYQTYQQHPITVPTMSPVYYPSMPVANLEYPSSHPITTITPPHSEQSTPGRKPVSHVHAPQPVYSPTAAVQVVARELTRSRSSSISSR